MTPRRFVTTLADAFVAALRDVAHIRTTRLLLAATGVLLAAACLLSVYGAFADSLTGGVARGIIVCLLAAVAVWAVLTVTATVFAARHLNAA